MVVQPKLSHTLLASSEMRDSNFAVSLCREFRKRVTESGSLLEISLTFPSMVKQLRMVTAFSEISVATIENGDKKDQILMKSK